LRSYLTGSGAFTQAEITEVNTNGYKSNPFVSKARAMRYIDTMVSYVAPRLAVTMGLQIAVNVVSVNPTNAVVLYPNPTRNLLTITNNASENKLKNAIITDLNGKVLKSISVSNNQMTTNLNLPAGIYLVQLHFQNGSGVKKLVVQ